MIGDSDDAFQRVRTLLPPWFGSGETPRLNALLQAYSWAVSFIYALYSYAKLQTRIRTASDGWLDLIAGDFFGTGLPRRQGQGDPSYRAAILANLIRERGTRKAVVDVLLAVTGREPVIFEPWRPADTGAMNTNSLGYNTAGGYGSLAMPYEAFITAFRPTLSGAPLISGYGVSTGAYNTPSRLEYLSLTEVEGALGDNDIYAAVNSVRPAGTTLWVAIQS